MNIILPKCLIFLSLIHCLIITSVDSKCQKPFHCGNDLILEFPFSNIQDPGCGLITVDGCDSPHPRILAESEDGQWNYTILKNISTNKFLNHDPLLQYMIDDRSCVTFRNLSLPKSPFISSSFSFSPNLTIFTCYDKHDENVKQHFRYYKSIDCSMATVYYKNPTGDEDPSIGESSIPSTCFEIQLPKKSSQDNGELYDLLTADFTLELKVTQDCSTCFHDGGQCFADKRTGFYCGRVKMRFRKILLIGGGIIAALISTSIMLVLFIRRRYTLLRLFGYQKEKLENERNVELFLKKYKDLVPIRYRYVDIKKMTNSFTENLGNGGYGSVYKGKLHDGHLVAVKILNESRENGEEFMNELASISRTSHINIVTLLGYCFEGRKRALVYEFMPNGSLEKFVQNTAGAGLGWQKMFEISLGIARGLEYLHQGCKTRILHFDIKPHNILLDKDFNPRISDFGLAKMCPNRSSIVSMMVARGTIGYIAPEVFCRNFGEVSHKSDVYSYGMMVLEIAGGKKNIGQADVDHTSEVYFPHYIYKQLEMDDAVSDGIINNGDESEFAKRKLIVVGLWCIQTDPKERPSMTKVVEMLEGNLESLQVPPKPYISSSPQDHFMFSTSETM